MWQLSISVDKNSGGCLDYIFEKSAETCKNKSAVVVRDTHGDRPRLTLGCDGEPGILLANAKKLIADCIVERYKRKFISSYITIPCIEINRSKAFLQALVAFDRVYEHDYVVSKLDFNDYIAIDGFLNFKLKELKCRWKDVCELASLGGKYIADNDTYMDMLSFLVSNIDPKADSILISQRPKNTFCEKNTESGNENVKNNNAEIGNKNAETKNTESGNENVDNRVESVNVKNNNADSAKVLTSEILTTEILTSDVFELRVFEGADNPEIIYSDKDGLLEKIIHCAPKSISIGHGCDIGKSNLSILKKLYKIEML
jgi:hypothetical protein